MTEPMQQRTPSRWLFKPSRGQVFPFGSYRLTALGIGLFFVFIVADGFIRLGKGIARLLKR